MAAEAVRNLANIWHSSAVSTLARRGARCTKVLAATPEMAEVCRAVGVASEVFPAIGIEPVALSPRAPGEKDQPLRLLYVGAIKLWKGIDLLLEAVARSDTNAQLTLLGDGPFLTAARGRARRLGLGARVEFRGRLPRPAVLEEYRQHDVLCHPSLHDSGAFTVLEAMARGLPVICLARGGPGLAVAAGGGQSVPVGRRDEIVQGLAQAIRKYAGDRRLVRQDGQQAQTTVVERYGWAQQAERMQRIYQAVCQTPRVAV
jgi:glycosyltransferase involved in cell wall biosynthesis